MLKRFNSGIVILLFLSLMLVGCTASTPNSYPVEVDRVTAGHVTWCFEEAKDVNEICFENVAYLDSDDAFATLQRLDNEEDSLEVTATNYGGELGYFVTAINGKAGDNDHFWKLYVNNEEAQAGISSITPKDSDVFSLIYEEVK